MADTAPTQPPAPDDEAMQQFAVLPQNSLLYHFETGSLRRIHEIITAGKHGDLIDQGFVYSVAPAVPEGAEHATDHPELVAGQRRSEEMGAICLAAIKELEALEHPTEKQKRELEGRRKLMNLGVEGLAPLLKGEPIPCDEVDERAHHEVIAYMLDELQKNAPDIAKTYGMHQMVVIVATDEVSKGKLVDRVDKADDHGFPHKCYFVYVDPKKIRTEGKAYIGRRLVEGFVDIAGKEAGFDVDKRNASNALQELKETGVVDYSTIGMPARDESRRLLIHAYADYTMNGRKWADGQSRPQAEAYFKEIDWNIGLAVAVYVQGNRQFGAVDFENPRFQVHAADLKARVLARKRAMDLGAEDLLTSLPGGNVGSGVASVGEITTYHDLMGMRSAEEANRLRIKISKARSNERYELAPRSDWSPPADDTTPRANYFRKLEAVRELLGVTPDEMDAAFVSATREQINRVGYSIAADVSHATVDGQARAASGPDRGLYSQPAISKFDTTPMPKGKDKDERLSLLEYVWPDTAGFLTYHLHHSLGTVDSRQLQTDLHSWNSLDWFKKRNLQAIGAVIEQGTLVENDTKPLHLYAKGNRDFKYLFKPKLFAIIHKDDDYLLRFHVATDRIFEAGLHGAVDQLAASKPDIDRAELKKRMGEVDAAFYAAVNHGWVREEKPGEKDDKADKKSDPKPPKPAKVKLPEAYPLAVSSFSDGTIAFKEKKGRCTQLVEETQELRKLLNVHDPDHAKTYLAVGNELFPPALRDAVRMYDAGQSEGVDASLPELESARQLARTLIEEKPVSHYPELGNDEQAKIRTALLHAPLLLAAMTGNPAVMESVAWQQHTWKSDHAAGVDLGDEALANESYLKAATTLLGDKPEAIIPPPVKHEPPVASTQPSKPPEKKETSKPFIKVDNGPSWGGAEALAGLAALRGMNAEIGAPDASGEGGKTADQPPATASPVTAAEPKKKKKEPKPQTEDEIHRGARRATMHWARDRLQKRFNNSKTGVPSYSHFGVEVVDGNKLKMTFSSNEHYGVGRESTSTWSFENADEYNRMRLNDGTSGFFNPQQGLYVEPTPSDLHLLATDIEFMAAENGYKPITRIQKATKVKVATGADEFLSPSLIDSAKRSSCQIRFADGEAVLVIGCDQATQADIPVKKTVSFRLGMLEITEAARKGMPTENAVFENNNVTVEAIREGLLKSDNKQAAEIGRRAAFVLAHINEHDVMVKEMQVRQAEVKGKTKPIPLPRLLKGQIDDLLCEDIERQTDPIKSNWLAHDSKQLTFTADGASLVEWKEGSPMYTAAINIKGDTKHPPCSFTIGTPKQVLRKGRDYLSWQVDIPIFYNPDARSVEEGGYGADTPGIKYYTRHYDTNTTKPDVALGRTQVMLFGNDKVRGLIDQIRHHFDTGARLRLDEPNRPDEDKKEKIKLKEWIIADDAKDPKELDKGNFGYKDFMNWVRARGYRCPDNLIVKYDDIDMAKKTDQGLPVTFFVERGAEVLPMRNVDGPTETFRNKKGEEIRQTVYLPPELEGRAKEYAERVGAHMMTAIRAHYAVAELPDEAKKPPATRQEVLDRFDQIDTQLNWKTTPASYPKKKTSPKERAAEGLDIQKPGALLNEAIEAVRAEFEGKAEGAAKKTHTERHGGGGSRGESPLKKALNKPKSRHAGVPPADDEWADRISDHAPGTHRLM